MRIRTRITAVAAAASLAGLGFAGLSGVANAATCSGSGCGENVNGTVTVPTTLTLTLTPSGGNSADSFSINTTAGGSDMVGDVTGYSSAYIPGGGPSGSAGGAPVLATVMTNDPAGYTLTQAITSINGDFEGGHHAADGHDAIPAANVSQLNYAANLGPTVTWAPFTAGGAPNTISSNNTSTNGDNYYLGYQVNAPGTTDADTYSATFTVTALAA